jgi:putative transposase
MISMDGKGRYMDDIFVERLWRSLKYEEVYLNAYATVAEAKTGLGEFFELVQPRFITPISLCC